MADTYTIQKFLNKKGFSGPVFLLSPTGTFLTDPDDGLPIYMTNRAGTQVTGFYIVKAIIDDINFTAQVQIYGYAPKKRSGQNLTAKQNFLLNPNSPDITFHYVVNNNDQVVDELGVITTPGTYDTFFAKDVVKTAGNCEQWKAIDLVLSLDGTKTFQAAYPYSFSRFSTAQITQANIDATNLLVL